MYAFRDRSVMYGAAGHRRAMMSRRGWVWCVMFHSNMMWLSRVLPRLPGGILTMLKVLVRLPVEDYGTWVVGCSNCLARAPHDPNDESPIEGNPRTPVPDDIREAVERWNNRKDLARPNHITEEA